MIAEPGVTSVSIHHGVPGDLNLPYPDGSSLQDTQEFTVRRTLSGVQEIPKNRFSENKKWVLTWNTLTQEQYLGLERLTRVGAFSMRDPLGRAVWLKITEFTPGAVRAVQDEDGRLMFSATVEALVLASRHTLYAPDGVSVVSAGSQGLGSQSTLSGVLHRTPLFNPPGLGAFGPVIEHELDQPPEDWDRSARDGLSEGCLDTPIHFSSEALDGPRGSVFIAFETGASHDAQ